jgi:hypothetical protein
VMKNKPMVRVAINIIFILGFFLLIITLFEQTKNLGVGVITILFCILFVQTRIQVSQYTHRYICNLCQKSCRLSYY